MCFSQISRDALIAEEKNVPFANRAWRDLQLCSHDFLARTNRFCAKRVSSLEFEKKIGNLTWDTLNNVTSEQQKI